MVVTGDCEQGTKLIAGLNYGFENEYGRMKRVVCKRPQEALTTQYLVDLKWESEKWAGAPDFNRCAEEHFRITKLLVESHRVVTRYQPEDWVVSMTSLCIRDSCIILPEGVWQLQCLLTDPHRIGEPEELTDYLHQNGIDKLCEITPTPSNSLDELPGSDQVTIPEIPASAKANGSDFVWIDRHTLIAAITEDTNIQAIEQIERALVAHNPQYNVKVIKLPPTPPASKMRGRLCDCLSILNSRLVLACSARLPEDFIDWLKEQDFTVIDVTLTEWAAGGADALSPNPTTCILPDNDGQLGRIYSLLSQDHQMKVEKVTFKELALSRAGLKSMFVGYQRD